MRAPKRILTVGVERMKQMRWNINQVLTVIHYLFFSLYYYLSIHINEQFLMYTFVRTNSKHSHDDYDVFDNSNYLLKKNVNIRVSFRTLFRSERLL